MRLGTLPQSRIAGNGVADLVHLLAELVDNATSFSPPQSRVEVTGNIVGKGLVVEISDQGMGMNADELARVNEMLADPPDFGVATLSADSRLGLFVVGQLAARHDISVRLSESDYGGVRAIVLVPSKLLLPGETGAAPSEPVTKPQRRPALPAASEPVTRAVESAPAPTATLLADPPPAPTPAPRRPSRWSAPPTVVPLYPGGIGRLVSHRNWRSRSPRSPPRSDLAPPNRPEI